MWDRAKYPYLARVAWGKAEGQTTSHLNVLVQDRLQREQHVLAVQLNGQSQLATQSVLQEQDAAWLNLHNFDPQWVSLEGQNAPAMWWLTEREGGWIPQLLAPNGSVIAELAESELPLGGARNVMGVSNKGRTLWVGVGTAPTRAAVMRIDAAPDAQGAWKLTASKAFGDADENALHSFTPSPDGLGGVLQVARNGDALRWTVQRANMTTMNGILGLNYAPVGEAITSYAPTPVLQPQVELVRLQVAERTYECAIIRPKDFVRGKKYPVINFVYAGPGVNIVSADTRRYVLEQWYAQQGFIVVSIDGRGTPGKGRAWERAIAGNLIDVAMADQVDALNVLCRTYPEMDARRIGVYGWSFGGYFSLLAPTLRPDVFKAAAAGAPVADWRDYDTHYTERYMGVPAELGENDVSAPFVASGLNKAGYDAANALTHVDKLASPLLILHGTADDNVYFTHSARMADALTRAGKTYEFIPLLSQTHGVSSPKLVQRMHEQIAWFFMRHLQEQR
jgi:dipeptidyl-peptidase-4